MKLSEFQRSADTTDVSSRAPWVGLNQNFFGLVEKVGCIGSSMKKRVRDKGSYSAESFRADIERYIGEVLWYLSAVATHFHIDLEAIAEKNLAENRRRWGSHRDEQGKLFQGHFSSQIPLKESFPTKLVLEFTNTVGPNQISWLSVTGVVVNGEPFGDPVDDNSAVEDGYRFHDILHFAFAAYLNWSPVVRKLLGNKRKSDRQKDKFDDGARARDTEEAVSNLIHRKATENNLFRNARHLDTDFLNEILGHVRDLEVRDRTAHDVLGQSWGPSPAG
jgi:NTP pyrophosphatase (non-canonical NTP hydrolase)